jgi:hypothetical protein
METIDAAAGVLRLQGTARLAVAALLARYGLELRLVGPGEPIVGSCWGDAENARAWLQRAGLIDASGALTWSLRA